VTSRVTPRILALAVVCLTLGGCRADVQSVPGVASVAKDTLPSPTIPSPTRRDWEGLANLPDWSGVWAPDYTDQIRQVTENPVPWNTAAAAYARQAAAEEAAGRPRGIFVNCLPEAMPSWMLVSHNSMEILFTPGRVTMLGESDGNRLRRIYTDGREHPKDPDPSFHGHSIGRWEGETLVVDTIGVMPQALIAVSEAVGVPNNGDLHVVERIHLAGPDLLLDELEIEAPRVMTAPWKTTRRFIRQRSRTYDIREGVCIQGQFEETVDEAGNAVFRPVPQSTDGTPLLGLP
jgi:hypothetical protein